MDEVYWHRITKERFATELADALYRHAHANPLERLVVVAPPKVLGNLRNADHRVTCYRVATVSIA
jgi:protein required for attachment to host cells